MEPLEDRIFLTASGVVPAVSPTWFEDFSEAGTPSHVNPDTLSTEWTDAANSTAASDAGTNETDQYDWIVQFRNKAVDEITSALHTTSLLIGSPAEFEIIRGLGLVGQVLVRSSGESIEAVDSYLTSNEHVANFELDAVHIFQTAPNDSQYSQLWGLNNIGQTGGTVDADIDAAEAWEISTGSSSIVVGVIDTGVDYTHPDLAANIWTNPGEIAGNGIDDDGNGFVDDIHGYDFVNNDGDPMDDNSHGTHVAGTIAGAGNNGQGVAGVNWTSSIMGLKFLSGSGSGYTSDAVRAVNYATMMRTTFGINVRVTNNSWGGGGSSLLMQNAIQASGDAGILFVAAAGNDGTNNDVSPHYPSNYDLANVLSVAATDRNDNLAYFSNYGVSTVHLAAPGVAVYSTLPGGGYGSYSGTSMATPHVAGVAALAWSVDSEASVDDVRHALLRGTDSLGSLNGKVATGGRLNALNTLELLGDDVPAVPYVSSLAASPSTIVAGTTVTLTAQIGRNSEGTVSGVHFYQDANANGQLDDDDPLLNVDSTLVDQGASIEIDTTGFAAETHTFFARAVYGDSQWTNLARGALIVVPPDDHGNSAPEATTVEMDGTVPGAIELGCDVDWFAFEAAAGNTYVFEVSLGGLPDSYMYLYDRDGETLIDENDDISWPDNPGSQITWTAEESGTYFLAVAAYGCAETGDYTLQVTHGLPAAIDLGTVDFQEMGDIDLAAGDVLYVLQTSHEAWLTVAADFEGSFGDVELSLFDGQFRQLAVDAGRIDYQAGAGETYYVGLSGSAPNVQLRLANLVHRNGTTVTVHGTDGDDTFVFAARAGSELVINGMEYVLDGVAPTRLLFDGGTGHDVVTITGSGGGDVAHMNPTSTTFVGPDYRVEVSSAEQVTARGGGGADRAYLHDSSGDDHFVGTASWSQLSGDGFCNFVRSFDQVLAFADNGGADRARLFDSAGDDRFVGRPDFARLSGVGFSNHTRSFDCVYAYANRGGADLARLFDSAGDDRFVGRPDYAKLSGEGFSNYTRSFDRVHAYANQGGNDRAYLFDSAGDDRFVGRPDYARLSGEGFFNSVRSFDTVRASAGLGGTDRAYLYDSAGDDQFVGRPDYAVLSGNGFYNSVRSFDFVHASANSGGSDRADLYDSAGNDRLSAVSRYARFRGDTFCNTAGSFDYLRAYSTAGGTDTRQLAAVDFALESYGDYWEED